MVLAACGAPSLEAHQLKVTIEDERLTIRGVGERLFRGKDGAAELEDDELGHGGFLRAHVGRPTGISLRWGREEGD